MEREINILSEDELDAVAGGRTNSEMPFWSAFDTGLRNTAGQAGIIMYQTSMSNAQAAAGR
jgi:hypothetical protein